MKSTPSNLAFVLTCVGCEAGDDVDSAEQATAMGWTGIRADPTGVSWNYTGYCPDYDEMTGGCNPDGQRELFA